MWYDVDMTLAPVQRVKEWWHSMPNETRFSVSVLSICGTLVLVLSISHMYMNITGPFRVSKSVLKPAQDILAKQVEKTNELDSLKSKDTDNDGLNDYSELYAYRTSPYLSDTDSDGIPDAIEIAMGTDPNCPEGTQCVQLDNQQPVGATSSTFSELTSVTEFLSTSDPNMPPEIRGAQQFIEEAKEPSKVTPAEVREALARYSLVSPEKMAGLTDGELLRIYTATYQQVLKIREAKTAASVNAPLNQTTATTTQ